jgi:hypothetical protein
MTSLTQFAYFQALGPQGFESLSTTNQWVKAQVISFIGMLNSLSNGLQVISGFIFRRRNNRKGSYKKGILPPVTLGSPIFPRINFL